MARQTTQSDPAAGPAVTPSPAEGRCRLGLHLGPRGFTIVAQVSWTSVPVSAAEEENGGAPEERVALGLVRGMRKLRDAFAGLLRENEDLREENRRLRSALAGCVEVCGGLLERAAGEALLEGHEADHARAWLALHDAGRLLGEPRPPAD
jgi:hypothetical protein